MLSAHVFPIGHRITVRDYRRPIRERHNKSTGPYYWTLDGNGPGNAVGFYSGRTDASMDGHGSFFALRIELANDHLGSSRLSHTSGYYYNEFGDTYVPIIARLPHGRGFLAGATMGAGMAGFLSRSIWETAEDAARAAHGEAERAAEEQREYEERENERIEAEEEAERIRWPYGSVAREG